VQISVRTDEWQRSHDAHERSSRGAYLRRQVGHSGYVSEAVDGVFVALQHTEAISSPRARENTVEGKEEADGGLTRLPGLHLRAGVVADLATFGVDAEVYKQAAHDLVVGNEHCTEAAAAFERALDDLRPFAPSHPRPRRLRCGSCPS
jgi:hypothetical protein